MLQIMSLAAYATETNNIIVYYSFKIIPTLNTSENMLTSINVYSLRGSCLEEMGARKNKREKMGGVRERLPKRPVKIVSCP